MVTMVTLRSIATVLAAATLFAQSSLGHSIRRNPLRYVSLIDDAHINTPSHRVHSHSTFDLTFTLHDGRQKIRLALDPNHDIIHDDFAVTHLAPDGSVRGVEKVPRSEHKVFKGDAFIERPEPRGWSKAGWARITILRDGHDPTFDGAFRIDGNHHNIQSLHRYMQLRNDQDPVVHAPGRGPDSMVVWRDSDVMDSDDGRTELKRDVSLETTCAADSLVFNKRSDVSALQGMDMRSLFGRQFTDGAPAPNLQDSIGSLEGCPTTRKVALVGIATDCTYWKDFNSSADIRRSVIDMVNKASQLFESTFKISLGIQNLTVSEKGCPANPAAATAWNVDCADTFNITDRLGAFSSWRARSRDSNAYWTLLTKCATGSAVGLAWRGQLCRQGMAAGGDNATSANVVVGTDTEWQIFAHETGHTFGAFHDCTDTTCPGSRRDPCCPLSKTSCDADGKFIMNPTTGKGITQFSPCSIGNICKGLGSDMVKDTCLTDNKNVKTITGSQCGNGIVESGEDCDCGGEQGCKANPCCDAKTCKFTSGSVCDPSNEDCCSKECKFSSGGTVCRASTGECDPEEVCTGDVAKCPEDKHKEDGDACGNGLACASGQCTSRDMQCRAMSSSLSGFNSTRACPGGGCWLSCTFGDDDGGQCMNIFNQNFLDGTPCGGGGKCFNGDCKGASTIKEIGSWIHDHKDILIPVVSVIGGLIVIAILFSIFSSIRRRIRRRRLAKKMQNWPPYGSRQAGASPPMPMGPQQQWNGPPGQYSYPPPPPTEQVDGAWTSRHRSARYA